MMMRIMITMMMITSLITASPPQVVAAVHYQQQLTTEDTIKHSVHQIHHPGIVTMYHYYYNGHVEYPLGLQHWQYVY